MLIIATSECRSAAEVISIIFNGELEDHHLPAGLAVEEEVQEVMLRPGNLIVMRNYPVVVVSAR